MCGIVAYVGNRRAYPILIKGLQRLEYRGYDSAGVGLINNKKIITYKQAGKVNDLLELVGDSDVSGSIGIGHTRWATHGPPNQINSHPHSSSNSKFSFFDIRVFKWVCPKSWIWAWNLSEMASYEASEVRI